MTDAAPEFLFEPHGADGYVPTAASVGPWSSSALHGGAVGALLAGLLEDPEQVMVRVVVDMIRPVPRQPLRVRLQPPEGGRRVVRQSASLELDGRALARARVLRMRRADLELPDRAEEHAVEFDPADVPDLSAPNGLAAGAVGWESFDSLAIAFHRAPAETGPDRRQRRWLRLVLPVVPGRPPSGVENVVAAADCSSLGVSARLPYRDWSFLNADLVVAFSRPPVGEWVGLASTGLVSRVGVGQSVAALHDAAGLLGQAGQSVLVERRETL